MSLEVGGNHGHVDNEDARVASPQPVRHGQRPFLLVRQSLQHDDSDEGGQEEQGLDDASLVGKEVEGDHSGPDGQELERGTWQSDEDGLERKEKADQFVSPSSAI